MKINVQSFNIRQNGQLVKLLAPPTVSTALGHNCNLKLNF